MSDRVSIRVKADYIHASARVGGMNFSRLQAIELPADGLSDEILKSEILDVQPVDANIVERAANWVKDQVATPPAEPPAPVPPETPATEPAAETSASAPVATPDAKPSRSRRGSNA